MQSKEIQAHINSLDTNVKQLGAQIQNLRALVYKCNELAEAYERRADTLMDSARYEEDPDRISQIYAQANSYINQATQSRGQAQQAQEAIGPLASQLRGYKPQYEMYLDEGQNKIAALKITVNKLMQLSGAHFGVAKIKTALQEAKNQMVFNQNLVKACQDRMRWIDQVCGSDGDTQYVKVLKR